MGNVRYPLPSISLGVHLGQVISPSLTSLGQGYGWTVPQAIQNGKVRQSFPPRGLGNEWILLW